jgi:hypothetical protein
MKDAVKHIAYANGTIRNAAGKLVAFYDAAEQRLSIDGYTLTFHADDLEHAMEIVGRRA